MSEPCAIVIPAWNGSAYLGSAIESVLQQKHRAWHIYLSDDCSTDNTVDVARSYVDDRITISTQPTRSGLYGNLVRALESVTEPFVVVLHQDDVLDPEHLVSFLELARKYPDVGAFWGAIDTIDSDGSPLARGLDTGREERIEPSREAWLGGLRRGCFWTISGSFTRTQLLRRFRFDPTLDHAADYDWLLRVLRAAPSLYFERPLTRIRLHAASASSRHFASLKNFRDYETVLRRNLVEHASDLQWADRLSAVWPHTRSTLGVVGGSLRRGNVGLSLRALRQATRLLALLTG